MGCFKNRTQKVKLVRLFDTHDPLKQFKSAKKNHKSTHDYSNLPRTTYLKLLLIP